MKTMQKLIVLFMLLLWLEGVGQTVQDFINDDQYQTVQIRKAYKDFSLTNIAQDIKLGEDLIELELIEEDGITFKNNANSRNDHLVDGSSYITDCDQDNIPPTVICKDFTLQLGTDGKGTLKASDIDGGSTDNCGITSLTAGITNFDCTNRNTTTMVELSATDQSNNFNSCTANVTVEDNTAPAAICKDFTLQLGTDGKGVLKASDIDGGSIDNCGISSLTTGFINFDCTNVNTTTVVELSATDQSNNFNSCTANVTVVDNTAPAAICKDFTLQLGTDGKGTLKASDIDGGSTDNCGITSLIAGITSFDCTNINTTTQVQLSATDQSKNFNSCMASVTVEEVTTIANAGPNDTKCSDTKTLAANSPTVGSGRWTIISGNGVGFFGGVPGTLTSLNPGDTFTGTRGQSYTLRWTINNGCTTNSDDVVISFLQDPSQAVAGDDQIVCSNNTTLAANTPSVGSGKWTTIAGDGNEQFGDDTSPTTTFNGTIGVTYTLQWTISNGVCSSTKDEVKIEFRGSGKPIVNAGPDVTKCSDTETLSGNRPTVGSGKWTIISGNGVGYFGGVPGTLTSLNQGDTFTGMRGQSYTLRWTIDNGCATNSDDVVISFLQDPSQSAAGDDQNTCANATFLTANTPSVGTGKWTVITGDGNGTFENDTSPTTLFKGTKGATYTLRWTISNGVCSPSMDDVKIVLGTKSDTPTAVCKNFSLPLGTDGNAVLNPSDIDNGSQDDCGPVTLSVNQTNFDCSFLNQSTSVTLTATNQLGNTATCNAKVSIEDKVKPVAKCKNINVKINPNTQKATVMATRIDNGSSDICGTVTLSLSQNKFTCEELGINTVTLTATDENGNKAQCTANVKVRNNSKLPKGYQSGSIAQSQGTGTYDACAALFELTSKNASPFASTKDDLGQFIYRTASGDFTFKANLVAQSGQSLAGVMIRSGLDNSSIMAYAGTKQGGFSNLEYGYRNIPAPSAPIVGKDIATSSTYSISKVGNTVTIKNGNRVIRTITLNLGASVQVGIFMQAGDLFTESASFNQVEYIEGTSNVIANNPPNGYFNQTFRASTLEVSGVNVYPVPAKESINVEYELNQPESFQIRVMSMQGALQFSLNQYGVKGYNNQIIDISHLSPGMYVLQITDSKGKKNKRFIRTE